MQSFPESLLQGKNLLEKILKLSFYLKLITALEIFDQFSRFGDFHADLEHINFRVLFKLCLKVFKLLWGFGNIPLFFHTFIKRDLDVYLHNISSFNLFNIKKFTCQYLIFSLIILRVSKVFFIDV